MKLITVLVILNQLFIGSEVSAFSNDDYNEVNNLAYSKDEAKSILSPTLKGVKKAVSQKDVNLLSKFISFPLNVTTNEKVMGPNKNLINKVIRIQNVDELREMFGDIFNLTNSNLVGCITVDNMTYDKYKGFLAAYGGIWISDIIDNGTRQFLITSMTLNSKPVEMWMKKNCKLQ